MPILSMRRRSDGCPYDDPLPNLCGAGGVKARRLPVRAVKFHQCVSLRLFGIKKKMAFDELEGDLAGCGLAPRVPRIYHPHIFLEERRLPGAGQARR